MQHGRAPMARGVEARALDSRAVKRDPALLVVTRNGLWSGSSASCSFSSILTGRCCAVSLQRTGAPCANPCAPSDGIALESVDLGPTAGMTDTAITSRLLAAAGCDSRAAEAGLTSFYTAAADAYDRIVDADLALTVRPTPPKRLNGSPRVGRRWVWSRAISSASRGPSSARPAWPGTSGAARSATRRRRGRPSTASIGACA